MVQTINQNSDVTSVFGGALLRYMLLHVGVTEYTCRERQVAEAYHIFHSKFAYQLVACMKGTLVVH